MAAQRVVAGIVTLWIVSMIVFAATEVLPGNAAYAILGREATAQDARAIEAQLHLNDSVPHQYLIWLGGVVRGAPGTSFAANEPVTELVMPRLANSAVLVVLAGVLGSGIGLFLGVLAAARRDSVVDHAVSAGILTVTALPEFVVGTALVVLFATLVFHVLPAVSPVTPGHGVWDTPSALVLPLATLVILVVPYTARMARGAMVDALESDYVEMATLQGLSRWRVLVIHGLPNAIAPTIQTVGLNLLYLAGGIVVVEYIFNFPGIGSALVSAVGERDIPTIQFIVLILAAFYIVVNIATDVVTLLATPRQRAPQ